MALAAGARIQPRSVRGGHKRQSLEKCGRRSSPDPAHITMFIITWVWTPEPASNSPLSGLCGGKDAETLGFERLTPSASLFSVRAGTRLSLCGHARGAATATSTLTICPLKELTWLLSCVEPMQTSPPKHMMPVLGGKPPDAADFCRIQSHEQFGPKL